MQFFELYHARSRRMPPIGPSEEWPASWTEIRHKEYPALSKTALPGEAKAGPLAELFKSRQSRRDFSGKDISFETLGGVIHNVFDFREGASVGGMQLASRSFPSAGARHPLELYLLLLRVSGVAPGLYHYSPTEKLLSRLNDGKGFIYRLHAISGYDWVSNAGALLVLTACFNKTVEKYGERGYRLALLEAGHAGENVYLAAQDAGLKCCALGLNDETEANAQIGIDGVTESVVHTIALGL